MNRGLKTLLVLVAVVCIGVAVSYPIRYEMETRSNTRTMERLTELRQAGLQSATRTMRWPDEEATDAEGQENSVTTDKTHEAEAAADPISGAASPRQEANKEQSSTASDTPTPAAGVQEKNDAEAVGSVSGDAQPQADGTQAGAESGTQPRTDGSQAGAASGTQLQADGSQAGAVSGTQPQTDGSQGSSPEAIAAAGEESAPAATPSPTPQPTPTPDRTIRTGALPFDMKEKVELDESLILPQYRDMYELNPDLVGWITVQNSDIDYPVVQNQDNEFYLRRDFFGEDNKNGQIILEATCDPYTPSYNLVISGHNMRNTSMFSRLADYYKKQADWRKHRFIQFDSLMEERMYVVVAAFYAADYDEDEEGFRYSADLQYRIDVERWLEQVKDYQLYNTGIDVEFGDEFLTLTTCNSTRRKNGRFVVICRRLREGEKIE